MLLHKYNLHLKQIKSKAIEKIEIKRGLGKLELRNNFSFEDASTSSTSMS